MKTVRDIRAVLYKEATESNPLVKGFLSLKYIKPVTYKDELHLQDCVTQLIKEGFLSKEVVICKEFKGRFFQVCPGSPIVICCNYRLINSCFNCLYDCMFCYLNSYLNSYGIVQFTNIFDVLDELDHFIKELKGDRIYRIGTGEFTDSLMMDEVTGIGSALIEKTHKINNIMIELKTKSNNIAHLLKIPDKGNTVISWSLNTQRNISLYEKNSVTLMERIEAARQACDAGYYVAFHFDPVIVYDSWEKEYRDVIDLLFKNIDDSRLVWISLGTFRYSPSFKEKIRERFPEEDLTAAEMFPGPDGKVRYFRKMRVEIYKQMAKNIFSHTNKPFVYLCMEFDYIWKEVFGNNYKNSEDLELAISTHLKKVFLN